MLNSVTQYMRVTFSVFARADQFGKETIFPVTTMLKQKRDFLTKTITINFKSYI